eukprot:TRINITY_DN4483_c3_g1_i4.p1 TRINITY_DN4483_c3_g1~~TRINITY_DN4483_c3_g1_i4.p1  ORF type:complete len:261 (-),score=142.12 TRINITY_DN4483_c3_g1_i4:53-745(-)
MAKTIRKGGNRNNLVATALPRLGRARGYHARGLWAVKNKKKTAPAKKEKPAGAKRAPRFYPGDATRVPLPSNRRGKGGVRRVRSSVAAGRVLILLSGRHRGRRVVSLGATASGLVRVAGPYAVNGVPLRRVNQAYVIATSAEVDVSKVDVSKLDDAFFARSKKAKGAKKSEDGFFDKTKAKYEMSAERKAAQAAVDKAILAAIGKDKIMAKYLKARFTLTKGQAPHNLKF